jgi:hypothetical protein
MTAFKDGTDGLIRKELRISQWVFQVGIDSAKLVPDVTYLAIHQERGRLIIVRNEPAGAEVKGFAAGRIVGETRPPLGPEIRGAKENTKLFPIRITSIGWQ